MEKFAFERSLPVSAIEVHNTHNVFGKSFAYLEVHSPGTPITHRRYGMWTDTDEIKVTVDKTVERNTNSPCYDPESKTLAFPSNMSIIWHLEKWGIITTVEIPVSAARTINMCMSDELFGAMAAA